MNSPCYYSRPIEGVNSNLRSPMLNSLREWGERRSTRVFALKIAQKRLEFEGVCTVTSPSLHKPAQSPGSTVPASVRRKAENTFHGS